MPILLKKATTDKPPCYKVILSCRKFHSPSIKTEIIYSPFPQCIHCRDRAKITCPGIISRTRYICDLTFRKMGQPTFGIIKFLSDYNQSGMTGNCISNLSETSPDFLQHISPISPTMRPRQEHSPLFFPFGRQSYTHRRYV